MDDWRCVCKHVPDYDCYFDYFRDNFKASGMVRDMPDGVFSGEDRKIK